MIEIGLTFGIAIYGIFWFLTLFMVLPFGIRAQHEAGEVVPGSESGAPVSVNMGRKFLITTVVSLVLFVIFYAVMTSDLLTGSRFFFEPELQ